MVEIFIRDEAEQDDTSIFSMVSEIEEKEILEELANVVVDLFVAGAVRVPPR